MDLATLIIRRTYLNDVMSFYFQTKELQGVVQKEILRISDACVGDRRFNFLNSHKVLPTRYFPRTQSLSYIISDKHAKNSLYLQYKFNMLKRCCK